MKLLLFVSFLLVGAVHRQTPPLSAPQEPSVVRLPMHFLEEESQASRMFRRREEQEFDLYLILLQESALKDSDELEFSVDLLAEETGLSHRMNRSVYARLIENSLSTLEKGYHLIELGGRRRLAPAERGMISLQIQRNGDKEFHLPMGYGSFHWSKQLSFATKWVLLVNLILKKESAGENGWLTHSGSIQSRFHLAPDIFQRGMLELRKFHLAEVQYSVDPAKPSELQQRWSMRPFYSFQKIEEEVRNLEREYGQQKVKMVRDYANLVYVEHDPLQIEQMVLLYNRYGDYTFRKIMAIVAEEPGNSPKRSLEYATALLQRENKTNDQ